MAEQRWVPDEQLVTAVLAGSCTRRMSELGDADRAWVVAGMGARGATAEEIAGRLGCSLRLIRTIRAQPMSQVCLYALTETRNFTDELRLRDSALSALRQRVEAAEAEMAVLRVQRDNLIAAAAAHATLCGVCGEPLCGYNLYENNGKRYCRKCGRRRAQEARDRRAAARAAALSIRVEAVCIESGDTVARKFPTGVTSVPSDQVSTGRGGQPPLSNGSVGSGTASVSLSVS